jgi:hypothetical protein
LATVACTGVAVHNFLKRERTSEEAQRHTHTHTHTQGERDAPACETRGGGGGAGEDCFSPYLVNAVVVARAVLLRGVLGRVIIVLPSFAA